MKVDKEILYDLATINSGSPHGGYEVVLEETVDERRCTVVVRQVLRNTKSGKFYETFYEEGLTECQDQEPYEYDPDEIELEEVVPVLVQRTEYRKAAYYG